MCRWLPVFFVVGLASPAAAQCEFQKLEPNGLAGWPRAGAAVDIDGERAVVSGVGRAHVLELRAGRWIETATLGPYPGEFASAVAISGETLLVGAPGDATTGHDAGVVRMFERQGAQWVATAMLFPANGGAERRFGTSVDVEGDLIVVGSPAGFAQSGSVHVFERTGPGAVPRETAALSVAQGYEPDAFGSSVAVQGDRFVASDRWRQSVHVYRRAAPGAPEPWEHWQELGANVLAEDDAYGYSVAIDRDTIVVGAPGHELGHNSIDAGAGFVYVLEGGVWSFATQLRNPSFYRDRALGSSVAVEGDVILVGAPGLPFDGDGDDAYVFERDANGEWPSAARSIFSGDQPRDYFGQAVALSNGRAIIGAPENRIGGDPRGAAYVTCLVPVGSAFCDDTPHNNRDLRLTGSLDASDGALILTLRRGWGRGYFLMGDGSQVIDPPGSGRLCIAGGAHGVLRIDQPMFDETLRLELAADLTAVEGLPGGVLAGQTWGFQAWWRSVGYYAGQSFFSNAVGVTFR